MNLFAELKSLDTKQSAEDEDPTPIKISLIDLITIFNNGDIENFVSLKHFLEDNFFG